MLNYLEGNWTKDEAVRLLARDTRRYAKRQYTWFSRIAALQWFDVAEQQKILQTVETWFSNQTLK
jgi:tRNA dimethylallyltransferase